MSAVVLRTEDMPESVARRLTALSEDARRRFVVDALLRQVEEEREAEDLEDTWWQSLTSAEQEAERERLRHLLSRAEAGQGAPASEAVARIRARYANPKQTSL